jgi:hypothetical protein
VPASTRYLLFVLSIPLPPLQVFHPSENHHQTRNESYFPQSKTFVQFSRLLGIGGLDVVVRVESGSRFESQTTYTTHLHLVSFESNGRAQPTMFNVYTQSILERPLLTLRLSVLLATAITSLRRLRAEHRRHARVLREVKSKWQAKEALLSRIPESRLSGINALPTELWGVVIETLIAMNLETKCRHYPRHCALRHDLSLRLVCHKNPPP